MISTDISNGCLTRFMVSVPFGNGPNIAADVDWQNTTLPINTIEVLSECGNKASIDDVKYVIELANTIADVNAVLMYASNDGDPVLCIRIADKKAISDTYDRLLDILPQHILDNDLVIVVS